MAAEEPRDNAVADADDRPLLQDNVEDDKGKDPKVIAEPGRAFCYPNFLSSFPLRNFSYSLGKEGEKETTTRKRIGLGIRVAKGAVAKYTGAGTNQCGNPVDLADGWKRQREW